MKTLLEKWQTKTLKHGRAALKALGTPSDVVQITYPDGTEEATSIQIAQRKWTKLTKDNGTGFHVQNIDGQVASLFWIGLFDVHVFDSYTTSQLSKTRAAGKNPSRLKCSKQTITATLCSGIPHSLTKASYVHKEIGHRWRHDVTTTSWYNKGVRHREGGVCVLAKYEPTKKHIPASYKGLWVVNGYTLYTAHDANSVTLCARGDTYIETSKIQQDNINWDS